MENFADNPLYFCKSLPHTFMDLWQYCLWQNRKVSTGVKMTPELHLVLIVNTFIIYVLVSSGNDVPWRYSEGNHWVTHEQWHIWLNPENDDVNSNSM